VLTDVAALRGTDPYIAHEDMVAVWSHFTDRHRDPIFGMHFAERHAERGVGMYAHAAAHAPDFGTGARACIQLQRLIDTHAQFTLSEVDGEHGQLVIRGYSVERLVERATFEDLCALLWHGVWPSTAERAIVRAALAKARADAFAMLPSLGGALGMADGMEGLRAAVGHLGSTDPSSDRLRLTGAIPVFAAAWARHQLHQPPVSPLPLLSHAADCLQMLSGNVPEPALVRALDA
jgi:hypothetical protein